jgi:hypothetical protein
MEDEMQRLARWLTVCGCMVSACGSESEAKPWLPYAPNQTAVIGEVDNPSGLAYRVVSTPDGEACIQLDNPNACAKPQMACGDDGAADVLVDSQGAVVDVICYPTSGVAVQDFEGDVKHVGNDVVLVLDAADDGVDVHGDITIDGNNVVLYGHGPDTSIIGGDLNLDKNNALVRGVRVEGDVTIDKNNPSIVDCVIEGDLLIRGNNVSLALCEVWGKLTIEGNNAVLVGNRFAFPPQIMGNNTICNDNFAFADGDDDGVIDDDELHDAISCDSKSTK